MRSFTERENKVQFEEGLPVKHVWKIKSNKLLHTLERLQISDKIKEFKYLTSTDQKAKTRKKWKQKVDTDEGQEVFHTKVHSGRTEKFS